MLIILLKIIQEILNLIVTINLVIISIYIIINNYIHLHFNIRYYISY